MWNIRTFGRDRYGNATGYVVERERDNQREVAGTFCGDTTNPGSFDIAYARALMCARHAATTN
jgi:hypothetical protein